MAKGFKLGGGGGNPLNFKVVGNPQPADPAENTIWVETDYEITGYTFSATQPTEPTEGMVWITVGTSSPVAFNALKKNRITVYPLSAKQYAGGAWVTKPAEIYQNGNWSEVTNVLLGGGKNTLGTPNFVSKAGTASGSNLTRNATQNSDGTLDISVKTTSGYWNNTAAIFPVKVLTEAKTLTVSMVCTSKSSSDANDIVRIELYSTSDGTGSLSSKDVFACNSVQLNKDYTVDIDISAIESFFIAVWFGIANASTGTLAVKVKEIKTV